MHGPESKFEHDTICPEAGSYPLRVITDEECIILHQEVEFVGESSKIAINLMYNLYFIVEKRENSCLEKSNKNSQIGQN